MHPGALTASCVGALVLAAVSVAPASAQAKAADPWPSPWAVVLPPATLRPAVHGTTLAFTDAADAARTGSGDLQVRPAGAGPRAALYSALLPGAGQYVLGQSRAWLYLGLEAAGWLLYLDRRGAGFDLREAYRDFAWETARLQSGPRVDGDFDYYETMGQWQSSGTFDADPDSPGVQPETDASRYNGLIWQRATGLFGPEPGAGPGDPQYDAALGYYRDRAYGPALLWDWSAAPGARAEYADIIQASDDRFRQATNAVGLVIANHVVSAVDAFIAGRRAGLTTESRVIPGPGGRGYTVMTTLRREY